MHGPINVKSPNNISKWQVGFNSAFKRLSYRRRVGIPLSEKRCEGFKRKEFLFGLYIANKNVEKLLNRERLRRRHSFQICDR
jgi:hypothetical protein